MRLWRDQVRLQDRQLGKNRTFWQLNFGEVTTQKILATCATQTDDIVMTPTMKVMTHDPCDDQ